MNLENSKTLQCLINAFAGESQARNRYTFFAKIAKDEGFAYISNIFLQTAENEKQHAKMFYSYIPNAEHYTVTGSYPFFSGNTYENLKAAIQGEREEWEILYKDFSLIAKDEGFNDISRLFVNIIEIEKYHAHRYEKLAEELKNDSLYKKSENTQWECLKCGFKMISKEAPCICPVCKHPQGYFKPFCDNI